MSIRSISRLKQDAKRLRKAQGISHLVALDKIAIEEGFQNWQHLISEREAETSTKEDVLEDSSDTDIEQKNKFFLVRNGIDFATLWPTPTSFQKSILDATAPLRFLLKQSGMHDYTAQLQGPDHKVRIDTLFLIGNETVATSASLYRPITKSGDPRIWFSKLAALGQSGDQLAAIIHTNKIILLNISKFDYTLIASAQNQTTRIGSSIVLNEIIAKLSSVADELLAKFKALSGMKLRVGVTGDTAVGMAVEKAIGVKPNSSRTADYNGIELKSWRSQDVSGKSKNRHTLFTKVPSWQNERCTLKSIAEFVAAYGYPSRKSSRNGSLELHCTVDAKNGNSQGLKLEVDPANDMLFEVDINESRNDRFVLMWEGEQLRNSLAQKHKETFWIATKNGFDSEGEYFELIKIIHTRSPLVGRFLELIESSIITVDHMISYKTKKGKAVLSEKGPAFKLWAKDLSSLFPEKKEYILNK